MKFWDASAVVPLLLPEFTSDALFAVYEGDEAIEVWWGTRVECASAIERRGRFQANPPVETRREAYRRLADLAASWEEVQPGDTVRSLASRLLASYDLRAADALQLAAALTAAEGRNPAFEFVCLDDRLNEAARGEGFRVIRPR
jgi:predicted nucleic acid-binding protein